MLQNTEFHFKSRQPFRMQTSLRLQDDYTTGPFSFMNPTRAFFMHTPSSVNSGRLPSGFANKPDPKGEALKREGKQPVSYIGFKWRSRDNRKGRHTLVVDASSDPSADYIIPKQTYTPMQIAQGVGRMFIKYPYWDVSWLVAVIFTLGSVVWVINAFFAFLPLVQPTTEFRNEFLVAGGVSAFIGATIFEIGSVLLIIEATNENRSGCFGWALERALSNSKEGEEIIRLRPDSDRCVHHHTNKGNLIGRGSASSDNAEAESLDAPHDDLALASDSGSPGRSWVWFPSVYDLRTHYLRELGFLAGLAQLFGATIFWISGFTVLPGINNHMSQRLMDSVYWTPQIIGGSGFIVSGTLYMLETQQKWYLPAWEALGWHIGFWNLIGAFGFTLCGALGPAYRSSGAEYEASLATFWGSWAFLIGSLIQWYESLDKYPVENHGMRHK